MTFPSPDALWPRMDAYLRALGIRINNASYGETEGGGHVPGSEHYQHRARDYGISSCDAGAVARAFEPLAHGKGYIIDELFFSPLRIWYADGTAYTPGPRAIERVNHFSHCHAGCVRGAVFPAIHAPQPQPSQPAPTTPPPDPFPLRRRRAMHLAQSPEDAKRAVWLCDGKKERQWVENERELDGLTKAYGSVISIPIDILGKVPIVGPTPP